MKKGFTLIELLGVIVLIAVIAMITTPVVLNEIKNSKEKAFIQSAYSLSEASETYQANNGYKEYTFDFTKNEEKALEIDGDYPDYGTLTINEMGKVSLRLWNDKLKLCIEKKVTEKQIKKTTLKKEECKL